MIDGLAPDGGLYVPESMPRLDPLPTAGIPLAYTEIARAVLAPFFSGWSTAWFDAALASSCARFDSPDPVPLVDVGHCRMLELFHGPTCAFKDLALSLMGAVLRECLDREGLEEPVAILVATSGDTGSAALAGFAGSPGIATAVFYPATGTSRIQRLQMTTASDPKQAVFGIRGTFDDAQRGVKRIFLRAGGIARRTGVRLSSANSINVARLLPQIVYYVKAWRDLRLDGTLTPGGTMNVCVPTGNFGDILAAWYAKSMGVPIGTLLCASNANRVLADFFATGVYDRRREFVVTSSPSMDILVSSNLERMLFEATGRDPSRTTELMTSLAGTGRYELSETERKAFSSFRGDWVDEAETEAEIATLYAESGYLADPHTAVASAVARRYRATTGDSAPMVVCATASPFKFPAVCLRALARGSVGPGGAEAERRATDDPAGALELARLTGLRLPAPLARFVESPGPAEIHTGVIDPGDMEAKLESFLGCLRP